MSRSHYPTTQDVDAWCDALLRSSAACEVSAVPVEAPVLTFTYGLRHAPPATYLRFESRDRDPFHGLWQPVFGGGPAPLLIHLPGYGAEISAHPELVMAGFNVLHVNPRGYATPLGRDMSKMVAGIWPVFPETISSLGERGYVDWLGDALLAVRWATGQRCVQPNRLGAFGTSQGGTGALVLASILRNQGFKAVAADLPGFTDIATKASRDSGLASMFGKQLEEPRQRNPGASPVEIERRAWRAVGFIDTLSHAHRLDIPVLLTAGTADQGCPCDGIRALFELLAGTRSYCELKGQEHDYTTPFLPLASAWFGLYL